MAARIVVGVLFLALLAAPFAFRADRGVRSDDAAQLIIITPHNEMIRSEFKRAFEAWHFDTFGERVEVVYNVPGGTAEIRRMLEAQYASEFEAGRAPGGTADLVFGGGSYEHSRLKRGVRVSVDGEQRFEPISQPIEFEPEWLEMMYGENRIGDRPLYDADHHWFGSAVSGFGIVFNRDSLRSLELNDPVHWEDLCDPRLRGWVALVNPGQSGSIASAFEALLVHEGWSRGWSILRRASANARYFSGSSLKPPTDVAHGDAAMGVCIDFYGRFEAQSAKEAGDPDRVGYIDPPGATTIDPDPISLLRGAPNPAAARRFVEFCLSDAGQALWQFSVHDQSADGLGPRRFELRRLPIRRHMYETYLDRMIDRVDPFAHAGVPQHANPDVRAFVAIVFAAMAMDNHDDLRRAWSAIVEHPAYPRESGLVGVESITDPKLREMMTLFDAMPMVEGPEGVRIPLTTGEHLADIREGWLNGGWENAGLWAAESSAVDALRRDFAAFFGRNYRRILQLAEDSS